MISDTIRAVLTHMPIILTIAALTCATLFRGISSLPERYLAWLLLLSVGVEMIWAGGFHVFAPATAAAFIGWQTSPFQFEIGVADLAMGVVAVLSFWRGWEFRAAVVAYLVVFYLGVSIGHLRQMMATGDTSPGNFGVLLGLTLIKLLVLPVLLLMSPRKGI